MYGIVDDDPNSKNGGVLLGEVVGEGEDEFLNADYAYLISTKESIGQYLDNK